MNLSAISRNLLRLPAKSVRRSEPSPAIEPLEARIAPATLVNPTTVTFQDKNGDAVTVTISKPLFTAASVAKVFTFDSAFSTGSAGGVNSTPQQLELLDIAHLGQAAKGMNISITAQPVSGSPGVVNVGFINASNIDLGNVTVGGDLGRISAGSVAVSGPGLKSLTVESLGAQGVSTQLPGGTLNSLISGPVGSITVSGDIDGASIGIGGGSKGMLGITASTQTGLLVEGSINGGTGAYSGSVRTQGGITGVQVDGSINGGAGADSGLIGTSGALGSVTVEGSVTGGGGAFSGAILSTKAMNTVMIYGGIAGGSGPDSGQVGTASSLGTVTVEGSVNGGLGSLSGVILASGNIATVTVNGGLAGGVGPGSGQIGSGGSIGTVSIAGAMSAGALIHAFQNIQTISVGIISELVPQDFVSSIANSFIIADHGSIGSILTGDITGSGVDAGGSIGPINAAGSIRDSVFVAGVDLGASFGVAGAGTFDNSSAASFGFGASKSAVAAAIGDITVGGVIQQSTFLAGVRGAGPDGMFGTRDDVVGAGSSIGTISAPAGLDTVFMESGNIGATNSGAIGNTTYISTDTAVSAPGIGPITVVANTVSFLESGPQIATSGGIYNSTFISNAGIGAINVTLNGVRNVETNVGIGSTTFQAGHAIGTITVTDNASGPYGANYGIFSSTFNGGLNGYGGIGDINVILTDAGPDGDSAAIASSNFDASVCSCMSANMGSISAENADTAQSAAGIVDSVFRVYGNIGPISATMDSGSPTAPAIEGSTFSAFGSIGDINVYGAVMADSNGAPSRFLAGYDIGSDMTFGNEDLSATSLALQGGQSIGNVTVTGYFQGSDIAASINPSSSYTFGDGNNTNVGAGGSIGFVNIGTNVSIDGSPFTYDHATSHAIEAANFALSEDSSPTVTAFGVTAYIPVVLYVDGGSGDVRITNLQVEY